MRWPHHRVKEQRRVHRVVSITQHREKQQQLRAARRSERVRKVYADAPKEGRSCVLAALAAPQEGRDATRQRSDGGGSLTNTDRYQPEDD